MITWKELEDFVGRQTTFIQLIVQAYLKRFVFQSRAIRPSKLHTNIGLSPIGNAITSSTCVRVCVCSSLKPQNSALIEPNSAEKLNIATMTVTTGHRLHQVQIYGHILVSSTCKNKQRFSEVYDRLRVYCAHPALPCQLICAFENSV